MAVSPVQEAAPYKVTEPDRQALKQIFAAIEVNSCPDAYNFHMHTVCSDGKLKPYELIEQAISLKLRGLAITDHHTIQGYLQAREWMEDWLIYSGFKPVENLEGICGKSGALLWKKV